MRYLLPLFFKYSIFKLKNLKLKFIMNFQEKLLRKMWAKILVVFLMLIKKNQNVVY